MLVSLLKKEQENSLIPLFVVGKGKYKGIQDLKVDKLDFICRLGSKKRLV